MLLLNKRFLFVFVILALQSCGFTPVYKTTSDGSGISANLQMIEIDTIGHGRMGQQLKSHLEDLFNPMRENATGKYALVINLDQKKEALLIEQDREINRYNIVITGKFILKDKNTQKILYTGKSRIATSYQVVTSDFATLSAEEDTVKRIVNEMAKDIRFKISDFFLSNKQ